MSFADRMSQFVNGIPVFILCFGVVFIMLTFLIFIIIGLSKMISLFDKPKAAVAVVPAPKVQEETAVLEEVPAQDDLELVAVITAVIAASMGTTSDKLQVRSLRKVQRRAL